MRITRLVVLLLHSALVGCTSSMVFIPDEIGERGLLVAQLSAEGVADVADGSPVISGHQHFAALRRGHIVVALEPGTYTFDEIRATGTTTPTLPGAYVLKTFPIKRSFNIEPGKVTNLGLLVLLPGTPKPSQQESRDSYYVLQLDNTAEMSAFLKETHPRLYDSLKSKTLTLAPGNYLDASDRNRLRHQLATQTLRDKRWQRKHPGADFVTGPAGTVARLQRDASGSITGLKLLETNTLADLSPCSIAATRVVCMKSATEYFLMEGDTVAVRLVPANIVGNSIFAFGERGIVLVDHAMTIYTSPDNGKTWARYRGAAFAKPLGYESFRPDPRNRFGFAPARGGYYVFAPGMDAEVTTMVYAEYTSPRYTRIDLPKSASEIRAVKETAAGLYVAHTSSGLIGFSKLHVLPAGKTVWESRDLPKGSCTDIAFEDESGRTLQLRCYADNVFRSEDGGARWTPIFRAKSLF